MNTIRKFGTAVLTGACLMFGGISEAQQYGPVGGNTNGWPLYNPVNPPIQGTLGLGPVTILNGIVLPPFTTNQYVAGNISSTNTVGTNLNQIYINLSSFDYLGLELLAWIPTNGAASGNIYGNVNVTIQKTMDGVHPDYQSAPVVLSLFSSNNIYAPTNGTTVPMTAAVCTNLDVHGWQGAFVTGLSQTNAATWSTNVVSLIAETKISKMGAVPATTTQ